MAAAGHAPLPEQRRAPDELMAPWVEGLIMTIRLQNSMLPKAKRTGFGPAPE